MNIRMLTPAERERLAYVEDHPDKELLGELVDAEHELEQAKDDLSMRKTSLRPPMSSWKKYASW